MQSVNVWSVLFGVYQSSEFYRRPFERIRLRKRWNWTEIENVRVLPFMCFAHSQSTHLISDVHTKRSKYHCNPVCSHARSSTYKRYHMAPRRAVRHHSYNIFPQKYSPIRCICLFSQTRALSVWPICTAILAGEILTVSIRPTKETKYCTQKRDGTDTDASDSLSLSLAFTHSQFLNSHQLMFEHRHADTRETVKQMISFCCQIACVGIVYFFHGLKV